MAVWTPARDLSPLTALVVQASRWAPSALQAWPATASCVVGSRRADAMRKTPLAAALVLLLGGCGGSMTETESTPGTPETPRAESTREQPAPPTEPPTQPMEASAPASASIPSLDVEQETMELGLLDNGQMEIPQAPDAIGVYPPSPTPGERCRSVLAGHLTCNGTECVFRHLDQMRPGEQINVSREDGSEARFEVTGVETYAKDEFPTVRVYGNTQGSELRLITCGEIGRAHV